MGTLKFNIPSVNISAQIGDKVYSVDLPVSLNTPPDQWPNTSGGSLDQQETAETVGGFYTNQNEQQTLSLIGTIKEINIDNQKIKDQIIKEDTLYKLVAGNNEKSIVNGDTFKESEVKNDD